MDIESTWKSLHSGWKVKKDWWAGYLYLQNGVIFDEKDREFMIEDADGDAKNLTCFVEFVDEFYDKYEPNDWETSGTPNTIDIVACGDDASLYRDKSLGNTDANDAHKNVSDLTTFGDADMFKLLCKASSKAEGWMKSTKAMEIPGVGCLVQVTTQNHDQVAEAVTFVPGVCIVEDEWMGDDAPDGVAGRRLEAIVQYKVEEPQVESCNKIVDTDEADLKPGQDALILYDPDSPWWNNVKTEKHVGKVFLVTKKIKLGGQVYYVLDGNYYRRIGLVPQ